MNDFNLATVQVCQAGIETNNWRNFDPNARLGFYIPIEDIEQLTKLVRSIGGAGVRVYSALESPGQPSTHHLYIVPVDAGQNDKLCHQGQSTIYDTTQPCPPLCSTNNPLNNLIDLENCGSSQWVCQ